MIQRSSNNISTHFSKFIFQISLFSLNQIFYIHTIIVIIIILCSEALNMHFGVTILRVQKGFDYSEVIRDEILTAEESFDKVNEGFSPDRGDDESQGNVIFLKNYLRQIFISYQYAHIQLLLLLS